MVKNVSIRLQRDTLNAFCAKLTAVFAQFVPRQNVRQQHRMSNIKSTHMGDHVRKGGILPELLKIRCANS